jgi:hypothetical protein
MLALTTRRARSRDPLGGRGTAWLTKQSRRGCETKGRTNEAQRLRGSLAGAGRCAVEVDIRAAHVPIAALRGVLGVVRPSPAPPCGGGRTLTHGGGGDSYGARGAVAAVRGAQHVRGPCTYEVPLARIAKWDQPTTLVKWD